MQDRVENFLSSEQIFEKWSSAFSVKPPSKREDINDLGRDLLDLASNLYGIPLTELPLEYGEEVSWKRYTAILGLEFGKVDIPNLWIAIHDLGGCVETFCFMEIARNGDNEVILQRQRSHMNLPDLSELLWKGFLLKHRFAEGFKHHRESIDALLGPDLVW